LKNDVAWEASKKYALVTGGCGFLGEEVIKSLLRSGFSVRSFDKAHPQYRLENVEYFQGDILQEDSLRAASTGVDVVVHAVAAVPLARSILEFREVNIRGTELALLVASQERVRHFVYISSSAVYGIPSVNPVEEDDPQNPLEEYGKAKSVAENLCLETSRTSSMSVSIVRPRTILGPGRLGIFGVLFDWVSNGASIPVIGDGGNIYQFVHVQDLSELVVEVALRDVPLVLNVGGSSPQSMKNTLDTLCHHAKTGARTFRISRRIFSALAWGTSTLRISPLAPYHWLLFGETMFFSGSRASQALGWTPKYSSTEALIASYDYFIYSNSHQTQPGISPHRSTPKQGILRMFRGLSKLLFSRRAQIGR
jgi:nucleoside-diphosphate-sugar epimerase